MRSTRWSVLLAVLLVVGAGSMRAQRPVARPARAAVMGTWNIVWVNGVTLPGEVRSDGDEMDSPHVLERVTLTVARDSVRLVKFRRGDAQPEISAFRVARVSNDTTYFGFANDDGSIGDYHFAWVAGDTLHYRYLGGYRYRGVRSRARR